MKSSRTIALMLILLISLCSTAGAERMITIYEYSWVGPPLNWTFANEIFFALPILSCTRLGHSLMLSELMPVGEPIGYQLNGACADEQKYRAHGKDDGFVKVRGFMEDFEPKSYAVKIVITSPDGSRLEREIPMDLGRQPDGKDELEVYYFTKNGDEGEYQLDLYVDGELEKSFEWEW